MFSKLFSSVSLQLIGAFVLLMLLISSAHAYSNSVALPLSKAANYDLPTRVKRGYTNQSLDGGIGKSAGYFLEIGVGTPLQQFTVLIDTGSADTLVPSDRCSNCGGSKYKLSLSSSVSAPSCATVNCTTCNRNLQTCVIGAAYLDGTAAVGAVLEDKVTIGGLSSRAFFGALTFMNGSMANGIMGLAYRSISAAGVPPVLDSLLAANSASVPNAFGMCLADIGGTFVLGDPLLAVAAGPMNWIPLVPPLNYYRIRLQSIQFGSASPVAYNVNAVVDSGSTMITMSKANYDRIYVQIQNWCQTNKGDPLCEMADNTAQHEGFNAGLCVDFKPSAFSRWPNLTFVLGDGATLTVRPRDYIRYIKGLFKRGYCGWLGISQLPTLTDSSGASMIILGDTFMRAFYSHFDRVNSRVGFAPVNHTLCGRYLKSGLIWPWWIFLIFALVILCCCCCICLCIYACYRCCCKKNRSSSTEYSGYQRNSEKELIIGSELFFPSTCFLCFAGEAGAAVTFAIARRVRWAL